MSLKTIEVAEVASPISLVVSCRSPRPHIIVNVVV